MSQRRNSRSAIVTYHGSRNTSPEYQIDTTADICRLTLPHHRLLSHSSILLGGGALGNDDLRHHHIYSNFVLFPPPQGLPAAFEAYPRDSKACLIASHALSATTETFPTPSKACLGTFSSNQALLFLWQHLSTPALLEGFLAPTQLSGRPNQPTQMPPRAPLLHS